MFDKKTKDSAQKVYELFYKMKSRFKSSHKVAEIGLKLMISSTMTNLKLGLIGREKCIDEKRKFSVVCALLFPL